MGELIVGRDIVLKEIDVIENLSSALPRKAQLGFSSLREHFSNRLESKSKKGNTVINSSRPQDPLRIEYTCIAVCKDLIAVGCNMGVLFLYDVPHKRLTRFTCEVKQVPVICIEFLEEQCFLAAGQFNGSITLFNYHIENNGNAKAETQQQQKTEEKMNFLGFHKILLKCTIDSHHCAPVTCLQWTPDGTKLFSADSEGHVAITVINMDEGQSHTVFICKENAAVVQLSFCHIALLVSSLERTLIWPFNTKTPVQVGQQPRKVFGNFGACFLPKAERIPGPTTPSIFAARPGLRVWRANIEGQVESTMIFKDAINKGEPEIRTLDLPAINPQTQQSTDQKQLGCLKVFASEYLVSWHSSSLYVLDPSTGFVMGSHNNMGCVVDIATHDDSLYVLTKDDAHFVRKITLKISMGSPLLEVRERLTTNDSLNQDFQHAIHRSSSVSQFEEAGSLDKLIDDVGSTMVGLISGVKKNVKKNVMKTVDSLKNKDDDTSHSSEGESSTKNIDVPTSTKRVVHRHASPLLSTNLVSNSPNDSCEGVTNGHSINISNNDDSINHDSETRTVNDESRNFSNENNSNEIVNLNSKTEENVGDDTANVGCETANVNDGEIKNFNNETANIDETTNFENCDKEIYIEHKTHEQPAPFDHLSGIGFSEIVFEGTSKEKITKRKTPRRSDPKLEQSLDETQTADKQYKEVKNIIEIQDVVNGNETIGDESITDDIKTPTKNELLIKMPSVTEEKPNDDIPNDSSISKPTPSLLNEENEITIAPTKDLIENSTSDADNNIIISPKTIPNSTPKTVMQDTFAKPLPPEKPLKKSTRTFKTHRRVVSTGSYPIHKTVNPMQWNTSFVGSPSSDVKRKETDYRDQASFDVLIRSTDSNVSEKSIGERCRRIAGEAIERVLTKKDSDCQSINGAEDSIESHLDDVDDEAAIEVVGHTKPPNVDFIVSPFPAPQVSILSSIYSQDRLSLSDMSLSENWAEDDIIGNRTSINFNDGEVNELLGSLSLNSYDSDDMTDIEDNRCDTPPVSIDEHGAVEMAAVDNLDLDLDDTIEVRQDSGTCSPSLKRPLSPSSRADKISERLRLLADSWAEITPPTRGQIQSLCITETLVWCIDINDHIYYTPATGNSTSCTWKKLDGRIRLVSSNPHGTVVWSVCRKHYAYYRTNIREQNPQGSDWYPVEKDILCISVDYSRVWGIKTNGDVFVRTGVSLSQPAGSGWQTVRVSSDLISITSLNGIVWALDIYNHVQMFQGDLEKSTSEEEPQWKELPGINAIHVSLGPKNVGWIIDCDGGVWFNPEISKENSVEGKWYQLSLGEYLLHDPSLFTTVWSLFKRGHIPKYILANEISGVWILGKYGSLHAARGHLLGTRWDICVPQSKPLTSCWTCVTNADNDFVWALQANNELHCFQPNGMGYKIQAPVGAVFKYISSSLDALWALTNTQQVYIRTGINNTCPQGLKWAMVDMTSQGHERLVHVSCGDLVVWAVDYCGNVWFEMGRKGEKRQGKYSPGWVQVDGTPIDGCKFTKVVVASTDKIVWACDDHNNVYARRDVTGTFLIGSSWEIVTGTAGKDLAISDTIVWALCPTGDVVCRFGVSEKNFLGDYWKKVPGCFDQISVGADDELWGIDRHGQLYRRTTLHFFGTQMASRVPSYSQLFPADEEWELI